MPFATLFCSLCCKNLEDMSLRKDWPHLCLTEVYISFTVVADDVGKLEIVGNCWKTVRNWL